MTLLIVRHGRAAEPDDLRLPGPDVALLPQGSRQARALANRLRTFTPSQVYTSDARRARATAEIIAAVCQVPLLVDTRLRELDVGLWAGQTYAEVIAANPAAADWFANPGGSAPAGGESIHHAAGRVLSFLRTLNRGDDECVVVGHAGSLRLAIAQLLGMPLSSYWRLRLDCAGLSILRWTTDGAVLERLNDTAHLESEGWDEDQTATMPVRDDAV